MITDISQLDVNKKYTYADYLNWDFTEMVELIKGKLFRMSPAPGTAHQWVSGSLFSSITQYLSGNKCKAFAAPFDIRLPLTESQQNENVIDTVVQPDICVICDLSKLDHRGCNDAPDWIIEILTKGTAKKDLHNKFDIYQHASVREYWIVHPVEGTVIPYRLDHNGEYQPIQKTPFVKGDKVPVGIFPDFSIPLDDVFMDLDL
jgi:Uma2 family endonuclease